MTDIADRLRKARGDKSSLEVSKAIGISRSAMQMYEAGFRVPRDEIKVRIAKYYNTTVQALFYD